MSEPRSSTIGGSSGSPNSYDTTPFGEIMELLQNEMERIGKGYVNPKKSQAHPLALALLTRSQEIKKKIIRGFTDPNLKIDKAFKDVEEEIPIARAIALGKILGHSGIQHDHDLKRKLSLTTALFWELVGFQSGSQSLHTYRSDVEELAGIISKIYTTLPEYEVETEFALQCCEAVSKRLTPGEGKVREVFKDFAPDIIRGALESAFSRNAAPAVSVLMNLSMRIYREIPLRWYRHTWCLTWGKEVKTTTEFDELAKYVAERSNEKSKAYLCFVNVIYDILVAPSPSQNAAQDPTMSSSSSSQPSTSSAPPLVDLKTYVFSVHDLSLLKIAEKHPSPNQLLKWRKKQKNQTFFDKYWKARYLCMIKLKQLFEKDATSFKTHEAASVSGRRFADGGERTFVRDAAYEVFQLVPADTAVAIAREVKLCTSDSLEGIQRELEATRTALEASQNKRVELEARLQEIVLRRGEIESSELLQSAGEQLQSAGGQLYSTGRQAQGAGSDSETSDDDAESIAFRALQAEQNQLLAEEEAKSTQRNEAMLAQESLEFDLKIKEYLESLLSRP